MPRILVIDDDPAIVEVLQIVLEDEGYTVLTDDGTAVEASLAKKPDLLLLDIWMRGIDGRAIAYRIKRSKQPITIILMSAHSEAAKAVDETGADNFIAKPFELDELIGLVKGYLKN
jgi:DNA-binding response OmpR family regulator